MKKGEDKFYMVNTSSNVKSIRAHSSDFLYCFQCLYQNKAITMEEKNCLVEAFQEVLASGESVNSKRNLRVILEDIFYGKELSMSIKQMLGNIMYYV